VNIRSVRASRLQVARRREFEAGDERVVLASELAQLSLAVGAVFESKDLERSGIGRPRERKVASPPVSLIDQARRVDEPLYDTVAG
jgi:hypothetical protein